MEINKYIVYRTTLDLQCVPESHRIYLEARHPMPQTIFYARLNFVPMQSGLNMAGALSHIYIFMVIARQNQGDVEKKSETKRRAVAAQKG